MSVLPDDSEPSIFERQYPRDRFGEEATDNARVWKMYRDKATETGQTTLDGWNRSLDILLIFAGLFSAVTTAFLIESCKELKPDDMDYLRLAFVAFANASHTNTAPSLLALDPITFTASTRARVVNALWFFSLTLSLIVALLTILAKLWLVEFWRRVIAPSPSHRIWAQRHLFYDTGLSDWGISRFISALPVLQHSSLFIFLGGLVVYLADLDWAVAVMVLVPAMLAAILYLAAAIMPLFSSNCPTRLPLAIEFQHVLTPIIRFGRAVGGRGGWIPAKEYEPSLGGPGADMQVIDRAVCDAVVPEERQAALDAIGSMDVLAHMQESDSWAAAPPQGTSIPNRNPFGHEIKNFAARRFEELAAAGHAASAREVAHCLRTLLFLRIDPEDGSTMLSPYQWRITVRQWSRLEVYDVSICANRLLDMAGSVTTSFGSLAESLTLQPSAKPSLPLASSLALILVAPSSPDLSALCIIFCGILPALASTTTADIIPRRAAFFLISHRITKLLPLQKASSSFWFRGRDWRMLQDWRFIRLHALYILGCILECFDGAPGSSESVELLVKAEHAYCETLEALSNLENDMDLHLPQTEHDLHFIGTKTFVRRFCGGSIHPAWSTKAVDGVLRFFNSRSAMRVPAYWSSRLGDITRNFLFWANHCAQLNSVSSSPLLDSSTGSMVDAYARAAQLPYMVNGIGCAALVMSLGQQLSSEGEVVLNTRLNLLKPSELTGDRSAWALARAIITRNHSTSQDNREPIDVAAYISTVLCSLHRFGGLEISQHVDELLGTALEWGSEILNVLEPLDTKRFAVHLKEISPGHWNRLCDKLRDEAQTSSVTRLETLKEFISAVDAAGTCRECPDGHSFREMLQAEPPKLEFALLSRNRGKSGVWRSLQRIFHQRREEKFVGIPAAGEKAV